MYRIRKVRTISGSTAIHVVQYKGHQAKFAKHIGKANDDSEFERIRFILSHYSFTILH